MPRSTRPILLAAPLLALAACALPPPQGTAARLPVETHVAGPASTNAGTPPYARLIPFENSMGIVQSRNSLPPGAE